MIYPDFELDPPQMVGVVVKDVDFVCSLRQVYVVLDCDADTDLQDPEKLQKAVFDSIYGGSWHPADPGALDAAGVTINRMYNEYSSTMVIETLEDQIHPMGCSHDEVRRHDDAWRCLVCRAVLSKDDL